MATSTLIDNIVINNSQVLVDYVKYMEELEKNPFSHEPEFNNLEYEYVTDPQKTREILLRGIKKWGKN